MPTAFTLHVSSLRIITIWKLACAGVLFLASMVSAQETLIPAGSNWRMRKGTNEVSSPVALWRGTNYDDSAWTIAPAPFHFGESLGTGTPLSDMQSNYTCIFVRNTFVITNVAEVLSLALVADIDDGFVAWVNGIEITRTNFSTASPLFNSTASTSGDTPPTRTYPATNSPQSFLVPGTNVLAVQAFNRAANNADFRFEAALQITKGVPPPPDTNAPFVAAASPLPGATITLLTQIDVTFSEAVAGVEAADLRVNGAGAASVSGSGSNYTFGFTQPIPGTVTVTWDAAHAIADLAGNDFNESETNASWTYTLNDPQAPQVAELTPAAGAAVGQLSRLEIMFTEPVLGVNASDLLINGQPAAGVVGAGAGLYVFQFPQPAGGLVQFAWAAGHGITDAAPTPNPFPGGNWSVTLNAGGTAGDVIINEFNAANVSGLLDEDGEAQDWIELYNRGTNPVNLVGWSLTDDPDVPGKWIFPARVLNAGEYLVVFASEKDRKAPAGTNRFHTNFKLNTLQEYLALFNPESPRVAVMEFAPQYPEQRNNYSYGLDGTNGFRYYQAPTPGAPNGSSTIAGIAPQPHFSVARGLFDAPFNLLLTTTLPGATIRYTLNGTEPSATNGFDYTGPLAVTNTATLRAATFLTDYLPSRARTHTYIFLEQVLAQPNNPPGFPNNWGTRGSSEQYFPSNIVIADYEMDLDPVRVDPLDPQSAIDPVKLQRLKDGFREWPVVSIVMKTEDMFGPSGIYHANNVLNTSFGAKPCSLEMILPDGSSAFAVTCGISMHGGASRQPEKNPKHGFKISFKNDFGEPMLRYRLFDDSPAEEYDDVILRADFGVSWRHWSDTFGEVNGSMQRTRAARTRDAFIKDTAREMNVVASHNRYCHLFINGLYWGTYDFSEQPKAHFASQFMGGTDKDYDVYEAGSYVEGTPQGSGASQNVYQKMVALPVASTDAIYESYKQYLDVSEYIDYVFLHFYLGHRDWGTSKNWYALRQRAGFSFTTEGKYKYIPWDGECILLNEDNSDNRIPNSGGGGSTQTASGLHNDLDDHPQYRLDFADRVHKHMIAPGGPLRTEANIERWLKWQAVIDKSIVAETARWGDYRRDAHPYLSGVFELYTRENQLAVENARLLNVYLPNRSSNVLAWLRIANLYPPIDAPEYREGSPSGAIIGTRRVPAGFELAMNNPGAGTIYYTTNGADPRVYYTGAISGSAQIYSNALALLTTLTFKARVFDGSTWSALNEATFTIGEPVVPVRITEIMYNPIGGDAYEFVEVQNVGALPIDVSGFTFQGIAFVFPDVTILQPGAALLLASSANPGAFATRYPGAAVFGYFGNNLPNGGGRIAILDRDGRTVTAVHYDDQDGWSLAADGGGYSLELIDGRGDPDAPANWRASSGLNGTPAVPPATPPALGDVVLNEVMAENLSTITNGGTLSDWVEIQNRGSNAVSLGNWSLTDDSNARKFVFPTNTTLAAGAYLVVWCDSNTNAAGLHSGFALGKNGDNVFLFNAATVRVDAVTFGLQLADCTIGRIADEWQLTLPTPNAANVAMALASSTNLAVNEWLANPAPGGEDWLELFNRSSNAPIALRGLHLGTSNALFRLGSLSFLGPNRYVQLLADENAGANHVEFKLPASGSAITLYDETGIALESIVYGAQTPGISEGRLPDGAANVAVFVNSVSPAASNYLLDYSGPLLNEVLARNDSANVAPWGGYADWLELVNPLGTNVNLGGMAIGSSLEPNDRWTIPSGTIIPAGGYLRIWCDGSRAPSASTGPNLNTGFSLPGESGDLYLFNPSAQPVDWVNHGFQVQNRSIGRVAGSWVLLETPTPGTNNSAAAPLGSADSLRINEWMADPLSGGDWFELYNTNTLPVALSGLYLTDDPSSIGVTNFAIPALSFIGGRDWVKWEADGSLGKGREHADFSLDQLGESIRLYDTNLALIDVMDFGLQLPGVSEGRLPDGAAAIVSFPSTATPDESNYLPLTNVVIHEVLAHTDPPLEDAIELRNASSNSVSIGGWYISNSQSDPRRYQITNDLTLPPGGFQVFYQYQFGPTNEDEAVPPQFTLNSARGDAVYLSETDTNGNLTGYRTAVSFGATRNGVAIGRYATSVGVDFAMLSARTFGVDNPSTLAQFRTGSGLPNAYPKVGPIVINELMYHPDSGSNGVDSSDREFIELHNLSNAPVPLYDPLRPTNTWRLAGAVEFNVPANLTVAANSYLLIVGFNPTNAALLAAFRAEYGTNGVVIGPYAGKLDNAGESVEVYQPDTPQGPGPDAGFVPYVMVDRVQYSDLPPWPAAADGGGASLQRIVRSNYGNDPINWTAAAPTAGRTNSPGPGSSPFILTQPISRTNIANDIVTFNVVAGGSSPLSYQWLFNESPIGGETGSGLTLFSVQSSNAGNYRVLVTNSFGSVLSEIAALTVLNPPTIATHPQSQSVIAGSNAVLTVTAAGTAPLHYQWQRNGSNLADRTNDVFTILTAGISDAGSYRVIVTNAAGAVTSSVAMLTVQSPPVITGHPQSAILPVGSAITLTVSATGDPVLSYQWRFNGTNLAGATSDTLQLTGVQLTNSGNYTVLVTNESGSALSDAGVLLVLPAPVLLNPSWLTNGTFTSALNGPTNWVYVIEYSTNLQNWTILLSLTNSTSFEDPGATNSGNRYYRARVIP